MWFCRAFSLTRLSVCMAPELLEKSNDESGSDMAETEDMRLELMGARVSLRSMPAASRSFMGCETALQSVGSLKGAVRVGHGGGRRESLRIVNREVAVTLSPSSLPAYGRHDARSREKELQLPRLCTEEGALGDTERDDDDMRMRREAGTRISLGVGW